MAAQRGAQWRTIKDFSPGIHQVITGNLPPGAATPDGTFGCYSPHGGVLAPLPAITQEILAPTTSYINDGLDTNDLPDVDDILDMEFMITGLHVGGPVFSGTGVNWGGEDANNTEIYLSISYNLAAPTANWAYFRYRRNWIFPRWDKINGITRVTSGYNDVVGPALTSWVPIHTYAADPAAVGPVVTAIATASNGFMFPDEADPLNDSVAYIMGDTVNDPDFAAVEYGVTDLVGHQGRLVYFFLTLFGDGNAAVWASNEQFFWSAPNDINTLSPNLSGKNAFLAQFGAPTGFTCMESLTSDELFLLKAHGGAIVLRGDLDDVSVVNMPYVRSPGFTRNRGVRTPVGFAYPVEGSGVWVWTGGQVSEHITPHLEGDFWKVPLATSDGTPVNFDRYPTQCAAFGDFVLFPNNWVWDTTAREAETGWWRIEDTTDPMRVIHFWAADYRGLFAYGTPGGFMNAESTAVYEFGLTTPRSSYQWTSQPLAETMETEVRIEEMVVVASAADPGEVTVRVFTGEDPVGQTVVFPIAGTIQAPTFSSQRINASGTYMSFEVISTSNEPDTPAPTIHEIRYSIDQQNRITNVG